MSISQKNQGNQQLAPLMTSVTKINGLQEAQMFLNGKVSFK